MNKAKQLRFFVVGQASGLSSGLLLVGRLTTLQRSNAPKFINFWCFYKDSMLPLIIGIIGLATDEYFYFSDR